MAMEGKHMSENDTPELRPKDAWDKFRLITNFLGVLLVAVLGGCFNYTLKQREMNLKLVDLAIGVLRSQPNDSTRELRLWAIKVVDKYSGEKLSMEAQNQLVTNALPSGVVFLTDESGNFIVDEVGNRIISIEEIPKK